VTRRQGTVVVVDDDRLFRRLLANGLAEAGWQVEQDDGSATVVPRIAAMAPDVVLLDLNLDGKSGLDVLRELSATRLDLRVIMVTGTEEVATAVAAMRAGAFDYVTKPVDFGVLEASLGRAAESLRVERERARQRDRGDGRFSFLETRSPAMQHVYDLVRRVAQSETTTVLIQGESGTGKEHIANLVHQLSPRREKPFLEINCASLPEPLLESELFGHEKGAFTDAAERKRGLLELADGGTLFLDEVGEMAPSIQVKMLRVLERMSFRRVGGTEDIRVSVRVVSATNRDLARAVEAGTMRRDLYFRLKVVPIDIPPLRRRPDDLAPLAEHFLAEFAAAFGRSFRRIDEGAMRVMRAYEWPGNIRELRNCMERAVLLHDGPELTAEMLQIPSAMDGSGEEAGGLLDRLRRIGEAGIPEGGIDFEEIVGSVERLLIRKAAEKAGWNQSRAARYLRLNRDKLRTRMRNHRMGGPSAD